MFRILWSTITTFIISTATGVRRSRVVKNVCSRPAERIYDAIYNTVCVCTSIQQHSPCNTREYPIYDDIILRFICFINIYIYIICCDYIGPVSLRARTCVPTTRIIIHKCIGGYQNYIAVETIVVGRA